MNGSIEHVESFRVPMEGMEMQALSVGCLYMGTSCIDYVGISGHSFGVYEW